MYAWEQWPYVLPFYRSFPESVSPWIQDMETFRTILGHFENSMYALEVQCAFATQMKLEEETKTLPGLPELHKHNYETSYHRTTALGCLHRIISGERHPYVFGIMIRCMIESEEHDEKSRRAVLIMKQRAKGTAERWVRIVEHWLSQQMSYLRQAMRATRSLVGEQMWQYAQTLQY